MDISVNQKYNVKTTFLETHSVVYFKNMQKDITIL